MMLLDVAIVPLLLIGYVRILTYLEVLGWGVNSMDTGRMKPGNNRVQTIGEVIFFGLSIWIFKSASFTVKVDIFHVWKCSHSNNLNYMYLQCGIVWRFDIIYVRSADSLRLCIAYRGSDATLHSCEIDDARL